MLRRKSMWKYKDLVLHKSWADFRADSQRTYLGVLWWAMDPIINMFIYYLIFGVIMRRSTPNFMPFLLVGLVMWRWFDSSSRNSARSIYANVGFVRQVSFPKIVFPLTTIATSTYQFCFSLTVLLIALKIFGIPLTLYWLAFPVILLVELMLLAAISLILGSVVPFVPDLVNLIDYLFRILFFLSGVIYDVSSIHVESLKTVLRLNPMVILTEAGRNVLMYQKMPDWTALGYIAAGSLVGMAVGASLIGRYNLVYAKRIV